MPEEWDESLARWHTAGLVDDATVARIREYESKQVRNAPKMWAVWVALVLGGIALGGGIFLFVAAHWDGMSPTARMSLVVAMVVVFHGAGAAAGSLPFRTLFHALGTLSVGAAIVLTAQIFNIEEHWVGGTRLWALAAAAGYYFLRDWPQGLMLAILTPAWLIGEWFGGMTTTGARVEPVMIFVLALALVYATNEVASEALRTAIRIAGSIALLPTFMLGLQAPFVENQWNLRIAAGFAGAVLLPSAAGFLFKVVPGWAGIFLTGWSLLLAELASFKLIRYGWAALGCVAFLTWAVRVGSVLRVNLGVAGFAVTVLMFYFSSVIDKLGRSLSLIGLGVLFLGGGWALDGWRRRTIRMIQAGTS